MTPIDFARSVYLGDRACKAINIDCWNSRVRVQVDCISRIRDESGQWNFYTKEDITDGYLVFDGIRSVELHNEGHIPNDTINSFLVTEASADSIAIEMSIGAVSESVPYFETILRLTCRSIHIEDPSRPGEEIYS
ncbi:MAG TPA: DUF6258 family protein [Nitrospira sp.]|nr:DUF6258 family protein [Nitrospira sp.]